jgi:hypothetical protein
MNDFLAFFDLAKFLIRALAWYNMCRKPPDLSNKNQRHMHRANRKLLRHLMRIIAASLPGMSSSSGSQTFTDVSSSRAPHRAILDTSSI